MWFGSYVTADTSVIFVEDGDKRVASAYTFTELNALKNCILTGF